MFFEINLFCTAVCVLMLENDDDDDDDDDEEEEVVMTMIKEALLPKSMSRRAALAPSTRIFFAGPWSASYMK